MLTHEDFLLSVRELVAERVDATEAQRLHRAKLTYGYGRHGQRGFTVYSRWANGHGPQDPDAFIEICAGGEESLAQLAGTTIHELGHVLAGYRAGHDKRWRQACERLGLRRFRAAGTRYSWAMFMPELRTAITRLGPPTDGTPLSTAATQRQGPCTAGVGTRGGTSRGPGSGSRLRKYVCAHGQIVRAATAELHSTCNDCGSLFALTR